VRCPYCEAPSTHVVDSRLSETGDAVRRRRKCARCEQRFTTYERVEATPVTVRKRDGRRERFDRQKLLRGLSRAANKRPVSDEQLEQLADRIAADVRRLGTETDAETIGELAMRGLAQVDPVTALLFASVYRNFGDLSELEAELLRIRSDSVPGDDQLALDRGPIPSDPAARIDGSPRDLRRGRSAEARGPRSHHAAQP
jgi:transcriptional repressor NrdR